MVIIFLFWWALLISFELYNHLSILVKVVNKQNFGVLLQLHAFFLIIIMILLIMLYASAIWFWPAWTWFFWTIRRLFL